MLAELGLSVCVFSLSRIRYAHAMICSLDGVHYGFMKRLEEEVIKVVSKGVSSRPLYHEGCCNMFGHPSTGACGSFPFYAVLDGGSCGAFVSRHRTGSGLPSKARKRIWKKKYSLGHSTDYGEMRGSQVRLTGSPHSILRNIEEDRQIHPSFTRRQYNDGRFHSVWFPCASAFANYYKPERLIS